MVEYFSSYGIAFKSLISNRISLFRYKRSLLDENLYLRVAQNVQKVQDSSNCHALNLKCILYKSKLENIWNFSARHPDVTVIHSFIKFSIFKCTEFIVCNIFKIRFSDKRINIIILQNDTGIH